MAYTLATLGEIAKRRKASVDYQRIWALQAVDEALSHALAIITGAVNEDIIHPPQGISNISEWCKKDGCWTRLMDQVDNISELLPEEFWSGLASTEDNRHETKAARQTQRIDNGIEAQRKVISIAPAAWERLHSAMSAKRLLTPKELDIINVAMQMPNRIPSESQSRILIDILDRGSAEGIKVE